MVEYYSMTKGWGNLQIILLGCVDTMVRNACLMKIDLLLVSLNGITAFASLLASWLLWCPVTIRWGWKSRKIDKLHWDWSRVWVHNGEANAKLIRLSPLGIGIGMKLNLVDCLCFLDTLHNTPLLSGRSKWACCAKSWPGVHTGLSRSF